jgi:uncharacterized protein YjiS (DUF1127 family)
MSTMSLEVMTVLPRRVLHWSQVDQNLADWQPRAGARAEPMGLSDRFLKDIGINRWLSNFEARKPLWLA